MKKVGLLVLGLVLAGCGSMRLMCPDLIVGEQNSIHCEIDARDPARRIGAWVGLGGDG